MVILRFSCAVLLVVSWSLGDFMVSGSSLGGFGQVGEGRNTQKRPSKRVCSLQEEVVIVTAVGPN